MVTPVCVEELPVCGRMRPVVIDDNWLARTFYSMIVERNPFDRSALDAYQAILDWPKMKEGESVVDRYYKDQHLCKIQGLGLYRSFVERMIAQPDVVFEDFCKNDETRLQDQLGYEQEIVGDLNRAFSARAGARWVINPDKTND